MIELKKVSLKRGHKQLLSAANLTIHPGEKVGLIGSNGSGKSSLLALLSGELKEEAGDVYLSKNWKVSSVSQDLEQSDICAIDFVLSGDSEWWNIQKELHSAELEENASKIVELHEKLETIDGYSAPARAGALLHGLGFSKAQQSWPTKSFSGGWQMRLNLARALMKPCDLMLLDEPTNHLDLDAIVWLEKWLQHFSGTLIVISHDSIFLDKVIHKVAWLDQRQFEVHKGNYTDFLKWRAEKIMLQQKTFEKQQQKRDHLQSFVDRFRAKASKAKQAQSRLKMLEKMEVISCVQSTSSFEFCLPAAQNCPNPMIQFKDGSLGYPNHVILHHLNIHLGPQDRIGLLGANGAGKSTLMKTLVGDLPILSGELIQSSHLKIGYFAQHQVDLLQIDQTPFWHLEKEATGVSPQILRNFLGKFGFPGDMAFTPIHVLSGGEKARLVLCLLSWKKPHLLVLDEPTNHLDLEMREALALALQEFEGAVVLVSHDRQLLGSVVDQFWLVAHGKISVYDEDLDAYADWLLKERKKEEKEHVQKKEETQPTVIKENKVVSKSNHTLVKLEKKIADLQKKIAHIDFELMQPVLYEGSSFMSWNEINAQKLCFQKELDLLEKDWYKFMETEFCH